MADRSPLSELIYSISNHAASITDPQTFATSIVETLARNLGPTRASLTLQIRAGSRTAFASAGEDLTVKKSRLAFSKNLDLRSHDYGRLQVDIIEPGDSLKTLLMTLEVVVQQLSLYAERQFLEATNEALWKQLDSLEDELATSKKLARATGIVAVARQLSFSKAKQWLESESVRTGRPVELLADLLVIQQQAFGAPPPTPTRKGAYAA